MSSDVILFFLFKKEFGLMSNDVKRYELTSFSSKF